MQPFLRFRSWFAVVVVACASLAYAGAIHAAGFTATANIGSRYGAADARLPDGRVLIAGGNDGAVNLASAVIWDPGTGMFTATSNGLSVARAFPLAVTLQDGRVLFADGGDFDDETGAYAACDIFDPSTETFAATGSTHYPRHNPTLTLLDNGKVLVAGGILNDMAHTRTATAELYDPNTGTWSDTGSMNHIRDFQAAVKLPNGKVLIAGGGDGSGQSLNTAEIYDPANGTFTTVPNLMVERRDDATATLLASGKVLIFGGVNEDVASGTAELFDYTNNTFTASQSSITPRHYHTATKLLDGTVLIAGGVEGPGSDNTLQDAQIYNPGTDTFAPTGSMASARFYHTATLLGDGRVLVAGGYNSSGVVTGAEVYGDLADEIFSNGFEVL